MTKYLIKTKGKIVTIEGKLFTGVYDTNGTPVWEGDIIEYPGRNRPFSKSAKEVWIKGKVVMLPASSRDDQTVSGDSVNDPMQFYVEPLDRKLVSKYGCVDWSEFFRCRVVEED